MYVFVNETAKVYLKNMTNYELKLAAENEKKHDMNNLTENSNGENSTAQNDTNTQSNDNTEDTTGGENSGKFMSIEHKHKLLYRSIMICHIKCMSYIM